MTNREKILALAEKVKNPPSWWWKVLGGLLLLVFVLWIRYLLSKKSDELAKAKTELATLKLKAQQAEVAAKVDSNAAKRAELEQVALVAREKFRAEEAALAKVEEEHRLNVARLKAVGDKDWDALNVLAGVKDP